MNYAKNGQQAGRRANESRLYGRQTPEAVYTAWRKWKEGRRSKAAAKKD